MTKKKEDLLHIQVKDNGLILSEKIGNQLNSVKANLQKGIIEKLISGSDTNSLIRYKIAQNNELRDYRVQTHKVIDATKKSVKNALKSDTTVNLTTKQINQTSKEINNGLSFLENNAVKMYQKTLNNLFLKVKSADVLKTELQKHINSGVELGVVYKDGKHYKFDSYYEMKARTDIQQDIGQNMVDAGNAAGVIFYIAAFFGDCAKDHVDYQGKIYVDKDWEANAPSDRVEEIRSYINNNNIKTVQEIMDAPYYFTTRPNCRHYFQYVDIDSVLGAKTNKQVSNLRDEMNLNFNGKYRPEKYEALKQQRANERMIRQKKEEVSKYEQQLALDVGNKELRIKILNGEASIRHYQAKQRQLEKQYSNIERSYAREQVGNRVDFGTFKQPNIKSNASQLETSNNGMGANSNYNIIEEHPKPDYITTIDINSSDEVQSILDNFKKEYNNLETENAVVISAKGEVYRCYGTKDRVYADSDLSSNILENSIFIHNHPKDVTAYSFSDDDISAFKALKIKEMYGIDHKYEYKVVRNGQKTQQVEISTAKMTFEDYQDWKVRYILKDSDIYYERKLKTKTK